MNNYILHRRQSWIAPQVAASCVLGAATLLFAAEGESPGTADFTNGPDQEWLNVIAASELPAFPTYRNRQPPTDQEVAKFFVPFELSGADKARDFYTRFPDHPKAAQARQQEFDMLQIAVQRFGDTTQKPRLEKLQKERGCDPDEQHRFELQMQMMEHTAAVRSQQVYRTEMAKGARELQQQFPKRPEVYEMLWKAYQGGEGETTRAVANEIVNCQYASTGTRKAAQAALARFDLLGNPVPIQFTALDGREVDTTRMRGKVVLIDFWATWCGPCVVGVPNIKAVYQKFHDQGFDVIGISLDSQKDQLASFVAKEHLEWPQFFGGAGSDNRFGEQFGIVGIPKLWLVDKRGNLRDFEGGRDLETKVAELLAE
jgi:thiol-disulfide isomerase/thioredoxin